MSEFVLSKRVVLEKFNEVSSIADIVSYSSKTNPFVTGVLEKATASMFSIHFVNELVHVQDLSRVIFLLQATSFDQLNYLFNNGVTWFVVDNVYDLNTVYDFIDKTDAKINLFLRYKLKEHTLRTEKYYVFGMTSKTIVENIELIKKKYSNNILKLGLHMHRKTQNQFEWNLKDELVDSFSGVFDKLDVINIGGGLPSVYANTNSNVINVIKRKIIDLKIYLNSKGLSLMIEPGRFISAPAVILKTRIVGVHDSTLVVDASVYNSDLDALIVPVKLRVLGEIDKSVYLKNKSNYFAYTVKGITPCSMDIFRYRVYLTKKSVNDSLIFLNAGAYNFYSDFCDLNRIPTMVQEDFDDEFYEYSR